MDTQKKQAVLVVVAEWLIFVATLFLIFQLAGIAGSEIWSWDHFKNKESNHIRFIPIVIAVAVLTSLLLNILLTIGIYWENIFCCKLWYVLCIIGFGFQIVAFVMNLFSKNFVQIVGHAVYLVYRIRVIIIILNFSQQLRMRRNTLEGRDEESPKFLEEWNPNANTAAAAISEFNQV